jgi:hypothetical protein
MLRRDCLIQVAKALGFSEAGAILRLLKTGADPSENDKMALEAVASAGTAIGPALYKGGNIDVGSASNVYKRLADLRIMGPNNVVQSAAKYLVSGGSEFDICEFNATARGPFSATCLQRAFRSAGCQPAGTKYPSERVAVSEYANMTWGQINGIFKSLNESTKSNDPATQNNALKECLGRGSEFYQAPKKACADYAVKDFVQYTQEGTDIKAMIGDVQACQNECNNFAECLGFSRSKTAAPNENAPCWLKKAMPNPVYGTSGYQTHVK